MDAEIRNSVSCNVPLDLQTASPLMRRFHDWKAAAAIRACIPLNRALAAPAASLPGILTWHRIVPVGDFTPPTWNVSPDRFRSQLQGLLQQGFTPWPLSRLIAAMTGGQQLPENVFVVTFDDGYYNNLRYALPVLKELQVPATIFLATGWLDATEPFPFDDWSLKGTTAVHWETWRALTIRECHSLLESNLIEFGSHTHTHEDFRGRPDAFRSSLQRSLDFLLDHFGIYRPALALPYGILNKGFAGPEYFQTAEDLGTTCCLTTEEELIPVGSSPFGWGRFIAEQHDTANTLAVKLNGWRDSLRNAYRRLRGR
ncbi:MAG: polysaccharide deacetylase family protein [Planctomycetaceae bacterium]